MFSSLAAVEGKVIILSRKGDSEIPVVPFVNKVFKL